MPYTVPLFSFVETRLFTRLVLEYLRDAEYAELQAALMADPEAGPVIPGSGGVRKLRCAGLRGAAVSVVDTGCSTT